MENESTFRIPDTQNLSVPTKSHYYLWLQRNRIDNVWDSEVKKRYLREQGFKSGSDNLSLDDYMVLKHIESTYHINTKKHWTC